jgi:nucleoside-diphosphate-sugar epimerase
MRAFITGASGKLGRAIFKQVEDIGAIPIVRKPCGLKRGVITNFSEEQLKNILKDADVIIHVAGSVDTIDKDKLWESNVELTRRIVNSAPKNCRIVFASSISIYGKKLLRLPADENTPVSPDSDYSRSKYEAEKIVATHPNHVILRIGTVYGPQFEDYHRILSRIQRGKMMILGSGKNRIPFVHVEDVARVFKNAIDRGSGVYVLAGEPLTQEEIYQIAAKELEVDPPKKHIGLGVAMIMAATNELLYKTLGGKKPQLTCEHIGVLAYDRVFDCSKAKNELGFVPRAIEGGIREVVKEYRRTKQQ